MLSHRYVKRLGLGLLSLSCLASAADSQRWHSPYLGAFLGGSFGSVDVNSSMSPVTTGSYFDTATNAALVAQSARVSQTPGSVIAGLVAGHDWSWHDAVLGFMADFSSLVYEVNQTHSHPYSASDTAYTVSQAVNTGWLFTLRTRLGYQLLTRIPSLYYVTGGMALTHAKNATNFSDNTSLLGFGATQVSQDLIGWAVGAGAEVLPLSQLAVAFEYLYVGMPTLTKSTQLTNSQGGFGVPIHSLTSELVSDTDISANIFRVSVTYHFNQ